MGGLEEIPELDTSQTRRPRPMEDEEDSEIVRGEGSKKIDSDDDDDDEEEDSYQDKYKKKKNNDDEVVCVGNEEKPSKGEIISWYLYGLCSYFIHTVLIPIIFPIIVSNTVPQPHQLWVPHHTSGGCSTRELQIYTTVTNRAIKIGSVKFSPLDWISLSWAIGLALVGPLLGPLSVHLDLGRNQQLVAAAATGAGAIFCLPAGFFKTKWIFPPYIAAVMAASTVATSAHARHLALMVRGLVGNSIRQRHFPARRSAASWLSLHATAAGCLGSAAISAFTYHMLRKSDSFTNLWIVSIFSGLIWFLGMIHIFTTYRPGSGSGFEISTNPDPRKHSFSIFKYPHAAASLFGVFLSSFVANCLFAGAILYSIGDLCIKAPNLLFLLLTYFVFPIISLPVTHPLQQLMKLDAVKMQLLGFILSLITSGFGFYFKYSNWSSGYIFLFAAVQSTGVGYLHAYGRVLLLDCSPAGKEGAFAVWFSWVRAGGACAGYALAAAFPAEINKSFGTAFCAAFLGMVILIFGNVSSFGGAKAAGNVREYSEKGSPVAADVGEGDGKGQNGHDGGIDGQNGHNGGSVEV